MGMEWAWTWDGVRAAARDIWADYQVYIFVSALGLLFCGMFVCVACRRKSLVRKPITRPKSFAENLLTWKHAQNAMNDYYAQTERIDRVKFYFTRAIGTLLVAWFVYWFVTGEYYRPYLQTMTIVYLVVFCVEYLLLAATLAQTLTPHFNHIQHRDTCLLIPFGGGVLEEKLPLVRQVLTAAAALLGGDAVYLLQNGRPQKPYLYEQVQALCAEVGVHYCYIPLPNKSFAIYYAARYLCAPRITQCLIIDDDVILPADFHVPTLSEHVDAVGYPICANRGEGDGPWARLLVGFQSMEYGMAGLAKIVQSRWANGSSVISTHGAIGLWRRERLVEIMSEHDAQFHGEDLMMGVLAYVHRFRVKMMDSVFVPTQTPTKVFGAGGLFRQRVWSWDFVVMKFIGIYLQLLVHRSPLDHLPLKTFVLLELWTIFVDVQRIPVFAYALWTNPENTGLFFGAIVVATWIAYFWMSVIVMSPFQPAASPLAVLLMPAYKLLLLGFRLLGELRYLYLYNVRQRMPLFIRNMPHLPDVLEQTGIELDKIDWDRIWSDDAFLASTLRRQRRAVRHAQSLKSQSRHSRSSRRHSRHSLLSSIDEERRVSLPGSPLPRYLYSAANKETRGDVPTGGTAIGDDLGSPETSVDQSGPPSRPAPRPPWSAAAAAAKPARLVLPSPPPSPLKTSRKSSRSAHRSGRSVQPLTPRSSPLTKRRNLGVS